MAVVLACLPATARAGGAGAVEARYVDDGSGRRLEVGGPGHGAGRRIVPLELRGPNDRAATLSLRRLLDAPSDPLPRVELAFELPDGWSAFVDGAERLPESSGSGVRRERWKTRVEGEDLFIAFAPFERKRRRIGGVDVRFYLDRTVRDPDAASTERVVARALRLFRRRLGPPPVREHAVVLLDSWINRDYLRYMRLGSPPNGDPVGLRRTYIHETAHLWFDGGMRDNWLCEGTAEFATIAAVSEFFGDDSRRSAAAAELSLAVETQLRDHAWPMAAPAHRLDYQYGLRAESISAQYAFGTAIFSRLEDAIGRRAVWGLLREMRQSLSSEEIDSEAFLKFVERRSPLEASRLREQLYDALTSRIDLTPETPLPTGGADLLDRMNALISVAAAEPAQAWELAGPALEDPEPLLQGAAAVGLARHARSAEEIERVLAPLARADTTHEFYKPIAFAVAYAGGRRLGPALAKLLEAQTRYRRQWTLAHALAATGYEEGPSLIARLFERDDYGRHGALAEGAGIPAARTMLLELVRDRRAPVFDRIVALSGFRRARVMLPESDLRALSEGLEDPGARSLFLEYLRKLRPSFTCALARDLAGWDGDPGLRLKREELLGSCG